MRVLLVFVVLVGPTLFYLAQMFAAKAERAASRELAELDRKEAMNRQNNSETGEVCVLCGAANPSEIAENEAGDGYEPMCKRCWDDQTEAHPYG